MDKVQHPDRGAVKVSQALGLNIDYAKLHLARWIDAQGYQSAGQSPTPPPAEPEAPPRGAELQISDDDANRAVSYRGTRNRTIKDLLAFSQTDTRIWEVERYVINTWEAKSAKSAH